MRIGRVGIRGWLAALLPPVVGVAAGCSDCGCAPPPVVVPDTAGPKVASTDPACASSGVATDEAFTITFNEAMAANTLNTTTVRLTTASGASVPGTVTPGSTTVTFTPTGPLAAGATFRLGVTTGATDASGNALDAPFGCRFTTAGTDSTAPVVESSSPVCGAPDVPLDRDLAVVFSEAMAASTINTSTVTLRRSGTNVPGAVSLSDRTAVFDPAAALVADADHTLTVTTTATDAAGNALASNFVCDFHTSPTVSDTTAPTVGTIVPLCNTTGAPLNTGVRVPFSEAMDPASLLTAITLTDAQNAAVAGSVDAAGASARFAPDADLAPSTAYTLRIGTAAQDLAGNALAAVASCTFTTGAAADTTGPDVQSSDPADGETDVCLDPDITATFSEDMDPATLTSSTFTLEDAGGTAVAGTVSYDVATDTATFTPSAALTPGTDFTAAIGPGARDLAGNALDGGVNPWTFTTGTTACP